MKTIKVDLKRKNYHYNVKIGSSNHQADLKDLLAHRPQTDLYIITNTAVDKFYPNFENSLKAEATSTHKIVLPDGEQFKNLTTISEIYDFLTKNGADRRSIIIAFGGGVIGDMSGYAAATFMRGISYIQLPTTLLSQVDSSIGGKTGVNHAAGKNFIGAFKQPLQAIIDVDFLQTLPEREFKAGYSELLKHGLIHDAYLFKLLNRTKISLLREDKSMLSNTIFRSCEVKARIVEEDEQESARRAILNFGHTLGHFLETLTHYKKFLHGEALVPGMDFAIWWSLHTGLLDKKEHKLIHDHLKSLKIRLTIPRISAKKFKSIIERDKKNSRGGISFIGLTSVGNACVKRKVKTGELWEHFCQYLADDESLLSIDVKAETEQPSKK